MNIWEKELEEDGAVYNCCFVTFLPKEWRCPAEGTKALTWEGFELIRPKLPQDLSIQVLGRTFCQTHVNVIERDYTN
jgi:hypothetical protein